ncbi:MAG: hypothetical protein ACE5LX_06885 [Nitrospinota bacterium]
MARVLFLLGAALLLSFSLSCGKKGDPELPRKPVIPGVSLWVGSR